MVKALVLYNSRGGNTQKVAMKIAEGLGAEYKDYRHIPDLKDYDLVVVGTWVLMFKVSPAGRRYMKKLSRKGIVGKKIVMFITCGGPEEIHPSTEKTANPRTIKEVIFESMENIINKSGKVTILPERFYVLGALRMFGKILSGEGHPSIEELEQARDFGAKLKSLV